jgi:hypothetical protein
MLSIITHMGGVPMTTTPLPGFLPADALNEFESFDGPLIYLAAPLRREVPMLRT